MYGEQSSACFIYHPVPALALSFQSKLLTPIEHLKHRRGLVYPAETLCLAVMAQVGLEPMATFPPVAMGVPHVATSESTHESTGQLVLSRAVKNTS